MSSDDQEQPFSLWHGTGPAIPILLAVPHAGRDYPPALDAMARTGRSRLEQLEDRYADLLIEGCRSLGVSAIVARRARAWLDLNRDPREVDPVLVAAPMMADHLLDSARVRSGLGLIPRRLPATGELWRRRLSLTELAERIDGTHRPYHEEIASRLAALRQRFGCAVLIDCHSMPPLRPGPAARIVIGDRHGQSAASRLVDVLMAVGEGDGLKVARNAPYAGGYTLDRHSDAARDIHAIQLEVDRSLYLRDDLRTPFEGLARCQALVRQMVRAAAAECPGLGEFSIAAE